MRYRVEVWERRNYTGKSVIVVVDTQAPKRVQPQVVNSWEFTGNSWAGEDFETAKLWAKEHNRKEERRLAKLAAECDRIWQEDFEAGQEMARRSLASLEEWKPIINVRSIAE